jgi:hypothetical protein
MARQKSAVGTYQVMVRGSNRQNIFAENGDYRWKVAGKLLAYRFGIVQWYAGHKRIVPMCQILAHPKRIL